MWLNSKTYIILTFDNNIEFASALFYRNAYITTAIYFYRFSDYNSSNDKEVLVMLIFINTSVR